MMNEEQIERAAKALADLAGVEGWNWYTDESGGERFPGWDDLPDDDEYMGHEAEWPNHGRNHYRKQARAALASAGPGDDLDALLDSVHPSAIIRSVWALRGGGWEARISVPEGPDDDGWYDYTGNQSVGTGATRMEAIANAVAAARREQSDDTP